MALRVWPGSHVCVVSVCGHSAEVQRPQLVLLRVRAVLQAAWGQRASGRKGGKEDAETFWQAELGGPSALFGEAEGSPGSNSVDGCPLLCRPWPGDPAAAPCERWLGMWLIWRQ